MDMAPKTKIKWTVGVALSAFAAGALFWAVAGKDQVNGVPAGNALAYAEDAGEEILPQLVVGDVLLYTSELFNAKESATLAQARPVKMPPGLELVATRINYLYRARDGYGVNGYPGNTCVEWPPKGFGPSFAVKGLKVEAKDRFAVNFFVRAAKPGRWLAHGTHIGYRQNGREFQQETLTTRLTSKVVPTNAELPKDVRRCTPHRTTWTGYEGVGDRVQEIHRPPALKESRDPKP